jgi:hypothetical protein
MLGVELERKHRGDRGWKLKGVRRFMWRDLFGELPKRPNLKVRLYCCVARKSCNASLA